MGTRGLYGYRWRGRYYVYYNHWDSYPSGLGKTLVGAIPSSPEEFQKWLQEKRSEYSALAKMLEEKIFTISLDDFSKKPECKDSDLEERDDQDNGEADEENVTEEETGLEDLELMPVYLAPEGDLWIEWVYIFDLDREQFGIHNACYFQLSKIPSDFEDVMEEAQEYWLGNVDQSEVHESITTIDIHPTPLARDPTPAYLEIKPTIIYAKNESRLSYMPGFVSCKHLYELFSQYYKDHLHQAQDCRIESDFLFRELVFALLCFTSCSPEWVRLVSTSNIKFKGNKSTDWAYGVILDKKSQEPKEFTTRFLQGYHTESMGAGSAPDSTSYWFSGALVYLRRDITSRKRFEDAIVSAVEKGKADGQSHFHAIIISLKHFILLKFANGKVQHTKRLNMNTSPGFVRRKVLEFYRESREEADFGEKEESEEEEGTETEESAEETEGPAQHSDELENTTVNDGSQRDPEEAPPSSTDQGAQKEQANSNDWDWSENADVAVFDILAHFFHAVQNEELKPSVVHNEGIFPNELYRKIIYSVDRETNIACLKVSRSFREFALETIIMDEGLKAVYRPGKEPQCIDDHLGCVGPFRPKIHNSLRPDESLWVPVFGKSDGSASVEPALVLEFRKHTCLERFDPRLMR